MGGVDALGTGRKVLMTYVAALEMISECLPVCSSHFEWLEGNNVLVLNCIVLLLCLCLYVSAYLSVSLSVSQ